MNYLVPTEHEILIQSYITMLNVTKGLDLDLPKSEVKSLALAAASFYASSLKRKLEDVENSEEPLKKKSKTAGLKNQSRIGMTYNTKKKATAVVLDDEQNK